MALAALGPWGAGLALGRGRGRRAGSRVHVSSSYAEVSREPSLHQPALVSQQLQILQGVSAVSHRHLDFVALGRRMPGAAGNPSGRLHPRQGTLVLSALASSLHTILPLLKSQRFKELCFPYKHHFPPGSPQRRSIYLLVIKKFPLLRQKRSVQAVSIALGRSYS